MSKSRFTRDQMAAMVSELNGGQMAIEVSRRHDISTSTLYRWRARFVYERHSNDKEKKRLRSLENQYRQLKRQFAELSLDYVTLRAALIKDVRGDC